MKNKFLILFICISILFTGCLSAWQTISNTSLKKYDNFEVILPKDWVIYSFSPDILELTKDGLLLQNIRFFKVKLDKELPNTKRKFINSMLTQETAQLAVDEFTSGKEILGFNLLENTPVLIGEKEGFRLSYVYHNPSNLKYKVISYGFKDKSYIYFIQYQAAEQYYFDKDINTFKEFVKQFKNYNNKE